MKQKPLKIAFDASPLLVNRTGVAYYIERLITNLARQHPDTTFVGFYYNFLGRRPTAHLPTAPNIRYRPVRLIPSKVVYQLRRLGVEIPLEVFLKERADFVLFGNFLGYPSLLNIPAAPVVHDLTYLDLPEYVSAKNQRDLERFVPVQIKRSAFVVTVSEFSKEKITKAYGVPASRVAVTPIPPPKAAPYDSSDQAKTLKSLGITKPFILTLGTVEPRKNIPNLVEAYRSLPAETRSRYTLVIAGLMGWNSDKEQACLAQAKADGLDVLHLGYVDEHQRTVLYQSAELFAHASFYEGFGMPVLEAMSYARPCAISDIPVFHEVAGKAAAYWDQADTKSIASTLQQLLSDPGKLKAMSIASKKRADSFSWDQVANNFFDTIRVFLGQRQ